MDGARVKGVGTDRHALTWRERQACVCVCVFGDVNTCEGTKHISSDMRSLCICLSLGWSVCVCVYEREHFPLQGWAPAP